MGHEGRLAVGLKSKVAQHKRNVLKSVTTAGKPDKKLEVHGVLKAFVQ
jgi:hypothetical protein